MGPRETPVLYVDLDSTVRHGFDELGRFVHGVNDVVIFPEAVVMMRRWRDAGGRIAGVTNQGGVALGHVDQATVVQALMMTNVLCGSLFDTIHACFHHPDAPDPVMARCWCRKPSPGAIAMACQGLRGDLKGEVYPAHLALFVGDRPEDEACAAAAMIDFQWAAEWRALANEEALHG